MLSVWKYDIPAVDKFELELPLGAEVLTVQMQNGFPEMWALVDPEAVKSKRTFVLVGTGHSIHEDARLDFVNTFQPHEGLVFHLFEVRPQLL